MSDIDEWGIDMTPEEGDAFVAAVREARRGPDPLTTLRAEVVRLRDKASMLSGVHRGCDNEGVYAGRLAQAQEILDLIDKQREQQ